jgi:hypothetical protein
MSNKSVDLKDAGFAIYDQLKISDPDAIEKNDDAFLSMEAKYFIA